MARICNLAAENARLFEEAADGCETKGTYAWLFVEDAAPPATGARACKRCSRRVGAARRRVNMALEQLVALVRAHGAARAAGP